MKVLMSQETHFISGGENIVFTQTISTEGFSDRCQTTLMTGVQAYITGQYSDDHIYAILRTGCSDAELDHFSDQLNNTLPSSVAYR